MAGDTLAMAQQLAHQISAVSVEIPVPPSEITRFREQLATPEQFDAILTVLQKDALNCLDKSPREALGLARVAYELTREDADDHARAGTTLTLAIVLNRMGEFRDALAKAGSAATEFEKCCEKELAARCHFEAAWAQSFLGHINDALADAERAKQIDSSELMNAHCDWIQARVLRDQGNYLEAEKLFEKIRAAFESEDMLLDAARCTCELAHSFLFSEHGDVVSLLQSAKRRFESASCIPDLAQCDYFMAQSWRQSENLPRAIGEYSHAKDRFHALGMLFFAARCDNGLGITFWVANRFDESLESLRRARDYFLAHNVVVEVSACDINIGLTFDALNRYDEALTYYQEAADLSLKEGREVRAARIFSNMGLTYEKKGLYAKALDFHQRALEILTAKGLEGLIGIALVRLAMACRQLGQYEQAIKHLQRAREIFVEKNLRIELAECEFNFADVYFVVSEIGDPQIHLQQARAIYSENELESLVAVCDRLLARISGGKGDRAHALSLLTDSRTSFFNHGQLIDVALCDLAEAEMRVRWNDMVEAEQAFLRAQAVLSPGFPDQAWRVDAGLGDCASAAGEHNVALEHYLAAVQTIAKTRSALVTEQLSDDFFLSRQSVYDNALNIAIGLGSTESALQIIEASKAQLFLSLLQNRQWNISANRDDPAFAELLAREKDLRYRLDALRTRALVTPPKDRQDALRGDAQAQISLEQVQELGAQSKAYESVVARLRLYSNGLAGVASPAPFALDRFREFATKRLGGDWAALDYHLSGDNLICIFIQPTHVSILPKKLTDYERTILNKCTSQDRELREVIYNGTLRGDPTSSPAETYLSRLHNLLIPRDLDAGTLIIAPHGVLHALPFHALRKGDSFLVQRHTLVYTPSLQALQFLFAEEPVGSPRVLAIGLSDFGDQIRKLSYANAEIEHFQTVFGEQAHVLWNDRATRQELIALDQAGALQDYGVVHFATHAILERAAPHRSRVLLRDEALTILDILDLRLKARLVTLSACETAVGEVGRGDELVGLARAFFYAGARALLASLWSVEDQSTAELIGRFYRHLANGENIAAALRHAQIEMIEAGFSPFQWASLALMGRP